MANLICDCIEKLKFEDIVVDNATAPCGGSGIVLLDAIDLTCCEGDTVELNLLYYNSSFFDSVLLSGTDVDFVTSTEGQIISGTIGIKIKCGCREGVQKIHVKLLDLCDGVCEGQCNPETEICVCDPCTGTFTCESNGLLPNIQIIK